MDPINRIAQARKDAGFSAKEMAEKFGVDRGTWSNWELGKRPLTLEKLMQISKFFGVGIAYLLGLDEQLDNITPVDKAVLPALHRTPVWSRNYGWSLVNSIKRQLVFADGTAIPFDSITEPVYLTPPAFSISLRGIGSPLSIDAILSQSQVWVEPISADPDLADELRGWYRPHRGCFVENVNGNKFLLDAYGAKWLAFENCLSKHSQDNDEKQD